MSLCELKQVGKARHTPVRADDLYDHAGRLQSGKARQVNCGFRMTRSLENSARSCDEGEDVTWSSEICRRSVQEEFDRSGSIMGRDPCSYTVLRGSVDTYRKRRSVVIFILSDHAGQVEFAGAVRCDGDAHETAGVSDHEIDHLGCCVLGGNDEVALVFAVLVIYNDDEFASAQRSECELDVAHTRLGVQLQFRLCDTHDSFVGLRGWNSVCHVGSRPQGTLVVRWTPRHRAPCVRFDPFVGYGVIGTVDPSPVRSDL